MKMEEKQLLMLPERLELPVDEWENIPTVIPRALQTLQKEVVGLARVLREIFHADRVIETGFDAQEELELLKLRLARAAADSARTAGELRSLENTHEELWTLHHRQLRDSERLLRYVEEAKGPELRFEQRDEHLEETATLWTMGGLKKLVRDVLSQSELKKQLEAREFDLQHIDEEIAQILKFNERLIASTAAETEALHKRLSQHSQAQEEMIAKLRSDERFMQKQVADVVTESAGTKQLVATIRVQSEVMIQKLQEVKKDIDARVAETKNLVANVVRRVKKRKTAERSLGNVGKSLEQKLGQLGLRLDEQERLFEVYKESLEQQSTMKKLEVSIAATQQEMKAQMGETLEALKADMKETKAEVYKKLSEGDSEMKSVLQKMDSVTEALEQWALKVIKPAQSNEAKIFTLETRIREEETQRITEASKLRDQIKKALYALEQYSIGRLDATYSALGPAPHSDYSKSDEDEPETSLLPPVHGQRALALALPFASHTKRPLDSSLVLHEPQRESTAQGQQRYRSPELLLLKRLRFVKLLMGGHAEGLSPPLLEAAHATATNFRKEEGEGYRFRRKRKYVAAKHVPNLIVEAKRLTRDGGKGSREGGNADSDIGSLNKGPEFDYIAERKKHKTFKNYISNIKSPNDTVYSV